MRIHFLNRRPAVTTAIATDGKIKWKFQNVAGANFVDSGVIAPLREWTHLAVTYNKGTTRTDINTYANGELKNRKSYPRVDIGISGDNFGIGARPPVGSQPAANFFNGLIDEVRVYNLAFGEPAIKMSYEAGRDGLGIDIAYANALKASYNRHTTNADTCPAGQVIVALEERPLPNPRGWFRGLLAWLKRTLGISTRANALEIWCSDKASYTPKFEQVSECPGNDQTSCLEANKKPKTVVSLELTKPLATSTPGGPSADYRLIITDKVTNLVGVAPVPVGTPPEHIKYQSDFSTRTDFCAISRLSIDPVNYSFTTAADDIRDNIHAAAPAPDLFDTINDRDKVFKVRAWQTNTTVSPPVEQELQSSSIYPWTYNWPTQLTTEEGKLVDILPLSGTPPCSGDSCKVQVPEQPANGQADLTVNATIDITSQIVSERGKTYSATSRVSVFICQNPWPWPVEQNGARKANAATPNSLYGLGFVDAAGTESLSSTGQTPPATAALTTPWTNFKLFYCRDAGRANEVYDDLPELNWPRIIPHVNDGTGILKEFFFTFKTRTDSGLLTRDTSGRTLPENRDSLGIRVYPNPDHLSALEWYNEQVRLGRFSRGAPAPTTVGGYDAVQDGRTYYINAISSDHTRSAPPASTNRLFTNIYVFSFSDKPSVGTTNIVQQLIKNFTFNVNLENPRVCGRGSTSVAAQTAAAADLSTVTCRLDTDCHFTGDPTGAAPTHPICVAPVDKLKRDLRRLKDLKTMTMSLVNYHERKNSFPNLTENPALGTFLPSYTNSKWRSWQGVLGNALGTALPNDPLNTFYGCGSSTVFISNPGSAACLSQPELRGLLGWWPGEGDMNDISGNNSHGVSPAGAQGPAFDSRGQVGQAFKFTVVDSSHDNNRIKLPVNSARIGNIVTVDFWMKWDGQGRTNDKIEVPLGFTSPILWLDYRSDRAPNSMALSLAAGNNVVGVIKNRDVFADQWVHIAAVLKNNQPLDRSEIYINGVKQTLGPVPPEPSSDSNLIFNVNEITIGARTVGGPFYVFHGLIDEVGIFNRALSAEEIANIYNQGSRGRCVPTNLRPWDAQTCWNAGSP